MIAKYPHSKSFLDEEIIERDQAFIDLIYFKLFMTCDDTSAQIALLLKFH